MQRKTPETFMILDENERVMGRKCCSTHNDRDKKFRCRRDQWATEQKTTDHCWIVADISL
ncbi:hypothetical protein KIN20_028531 [Parelaphostrongylus tenuis]|uniref:Uncharacterized protein n=1 Tax=Parelaphostrongylus tenuis TaxID=148309 RepID=A0AAD5R101_PARTN|nr:hypothetical protein KIN20_028531 [Parelaphostrongylus tenuis]